MKRIKITYKQLIEAIGAKDESPLDDGGEIINHGTEVFANHPNVDNDGDDYIPTTPNKITITPQMTGDIGRIKRI